MYPLDPSKQPGDRTQALLLELCRKAGVRVETEEGRTLRDYLEGPGIEAGWLADFPGVLGRGDITLVVGEPGVGKTTGVVTGIVRPLAQRGLRVVVITEEAPRRWSQRAKAYQARGCLSRDDMARIRIFQAHKAVQALDWALQHKADLLVVDSLMAFPMEDPNQPVNVGAVLHRLREVATRGHLAVLVTASNGWIWTGQAEAQADIVYVARRGRAGLFWKRKKSCDEETPPWVFFDPDPRFPGARILQARPVRSPRPHP